MAKPWFRLYRTLVDNPKAQALNPLLFKAWINILCCTDDSGQIPDMSVLSFKLRKPEAIVSKWISDLTAAGFIVDGRAHDWEEHQFRSDVSTERVKRFRERSTQRSCNAERNAPDTDTDTDTEKKNMSGSEKTDPDFLTFWKAYPRTPNMSRKDALKAWGAAKRAGTLPDLPRLLQAVNAYKAFIDRESRKGKPHPVKHAQGWLSGQRWEPYLETDMPFATSAARADWADSDPSWAAFKKSVPAAVWTNFFADCEWEDGILRAPSKFVRDQIESRFRSQLTAVFPNFEVELKRA
jgi:hypothetical protein